MFAIVTYGRRTVRDLRASFQLANRRLTDAELIGDKDAAHAVFDQIPLDLPREVSARTFEPFQDEDPLVVSERAKG